MKFRSLMLAGLLGVVVCNVFAHGNKVHISGTIEKINSDSIMVKKEDGKSVEVKLVAATVYVLHVASDPVKPADVNTDKPAKVSDLAVGDKVVIHATPKDNTFEAAEIKFSVPGAAKAVTAKPKS
jgi:hypothetical protein